MIHFWILEEQLIKFVDFCGKNNLTYKWLNFAACWNHTDKEAQMEMSFEQHEIWMNHDLKI